MHLRVERHHLHAQRRAGRSAARPPQVAPGHPLEAPPAAEAAELRRLERVLRALRERGGGPGGLPPELQRLHDEALEVQHAKALQAHLQQPRPPALSGPERPVRARAAGALRRVGAVEHVRVAARGAARVADGEAPQRSPGLQLPPRAGRRARLHGARVHRAEAPRAAEHVHAEVLDVGPNLAGRGPLPGTAPRTGTPRGRRRRRSKLPLLQRRGEGPQLRGPQAWAQTAAGAARRRQRAQLRRGGAGLRDGGGDAQHSGQRGALHGDEGVAGAEVGAGEAVAEAQDAAPGGVARLRRGAELEERGRRGGAGGGLAQVEHAHHAAGDGDWLQLLRGRRAVAGVGGGGGGVGGRGQPRLEREVAQVEARGAAARVRAAPED